MNKTVKNEDRSSRFLDKKLYKNALGISISLQEEFSRFKVDPPIVPLSWSNSCLMLFSSKLKVKGNAKTNQDDCLFLEKKPAP